MVSRQYDIFSELYFKKIVSHQSLILSKWYLVKVKIGISSINGGGGGGSG